MTLKWMLSAGTGSLVAALGTVTLIGGTAWSAPSKGVQAAPAAAPSSKAAIGFVNPGAATAPPGYVIETADFTATNNVQSTGSVACPSGTVAWGGGADSASDSLAVNLNSSISYGGGAGWEAWVNNASGADTAFTVYVVCANIPTNYQVIDSSSLDNPSGAQTSVTAACPKRTVALGGGGYSDSGNTNVNVNTDEPTTIGKAQGWRVDVNNGSGSDALFRTEAICAKKPKGYHIQSAGADNPPATETAIPASCPVNTSVVGGGVLSSSGSTSVNVNSTGPDGSGGWLSWENNGSGADASMTTFAVCAK